MTTIAYDGLTLAADSRIVSNFYEDVNKLFFIKKKIVGGCGEFQQVVLFAGWLKGCVDKSRPEDMNAFNALVIENNKCYRYESNLIPIKVSSPHAIGSGSDFAMGAMLAGKSAEEAVKIARKLDVYTGGRIRSVRLK